MEDARVKEIYETIEKLVVELDNDPAARGPGYLQDLIAKTRGFLNQVSFFLTEVLREIHVQEMYAETLEAAFQVQSDELMTQNRQVSTLPAIQDRVAMVNVMLAPQRREITAAKRILKNLSHVERVVRHRHKELENTMSAIRLQRSLLETEIRTGAFYGDEGEQTRGSRWGKSTASSEGDGLGMDEIENLLKEAAGQEETSVPQAEAAPAPAEETVDDDIAELLEAAEQSGAFSAGPQDVGATSAKSTNGLGQAQPPVEADDPDIQRFLTQEDDDNDLFKDL